MVFYRKRTISLFILLSLFIISGCSNQPLDGQHSATADELKEIVEEAEIELYEQIVSQFKDISIKEIEVTLLETGQIEDYYFYFGRKTCFFCRGFVIENAEALKNKNMFYYINTENLSKEEKKLLEEFEITEIPVILRVRGNKDKTLISVDEFIKEIGDEA